MRDGALAPGPMRPQGGRLEAPPPACGGPKAGPAHWSARLAMAT